MKPRLLTCPGCRQEFELAEWQEEDGPCGGTGNFYCVTCIAEDRCECARYMKWLDTQLPL